MGDVHPSATKLLSPTLSSRQITLRLNHGIYKREYSVHKFTLIILSTLVVVCIASPVRAESNWLNAGEYGTKPDRVMVMIDLGEVKADVLYQEDKGPFIALPIYIIYEAANKPDYSRMTLRSYCAKGVSEVANASSYWRHDVKEFGLSGFRFTPSHDWTKIAFDLVCGDSEAALQSDQFKPIDEASAKHWYPASYPWKKVWLDGRRPAYTTNDKRTQADKDAEWEAKSAGLSKMLGSTESMLLAQIKKSDEETAFWDDQVERRKNRPKSKLNPYLEGWLRKDEQYIVQNLGVPDGLYVAGSSRFLTYFNGWSQRFTTTNQMSGQVMAVSEESYICELTMELQNNKLIDFKFKGNSCGFGEFSGH